METTAVATTEITSLSWLIYWMRERYRFLIQIEWEIIDWELDNEILYGIHWKIRRPDLKPPYLIVT